MIERNAAWDCRGPSDHALVLGHEVLDRFVEHEGEHVVDEDLERIEGQQDGDDHGGDRRHVRARVDGRDEQVAHDGAGQREDRAYDDADEQRRASPLGADR